MAESVGQTLGSDAVATLKHLALVGAFDGEAKLTSSDLASRLGTSTQTASRRLKRADETGLVEREIVSDGQWVQLTEAGQKRVRAEYDAYQRIFERPAAVELRGLVTSGVGEGRHYVTLPGYARQFHVRLGYEPFPGTLNVELDDESGRERARLWRLDARKIDGWEDDNRTYGPAYCYPATVAAGGQSIEGAHVVAPERTHHGDGQIEVIAPVKLRDELDLEDDDEVTVRVSE